MGGCRVKHPVPAGHAVALARFMCARFRLTQGTPEQKATVQRILSAKCFYTVLEIERTASDDDIKKAYRKVCTPRGGGCAARRGLAP